MKVFEITDPLDEVEISIWKKIVKNQDLSLAHKVSGIPVFDMDPEELATARRFLRVLRDDGRVWPTRSSYKAGDKVFDADYNFSTSKHEFYPGVILYRTAPHALGDEPDEAGIRYLVAMDGIQQLKWFLAKGVIPMSTVLKDMKR